LAGETLKLQSYKSDINRERGALIFNRVAATLARLFEQTAASLSSRSLERQRGSFISPLSVIGY